MTIDHIGYAVREITKAERAMEALGFAFEETIEDHDRNIAIAFGVMDGYRIELVAPLDGESPVDTYLAKTGPTPYHICYKSTNIEADIERLKTKRFKVSIPLAPAVAFEGKRVVFLYSLSVGMIEIVES